MGSCWGKQRCIFPAERNHMGIGAVEKNMLLILDIISITQVTGGGRRDMLQPLVNEWFLEGSRVFTFYVW